MARITELGEAAADVLDGSCTPKISCTTSTVGKGPPDAGMARYAESWPSATGIFTSPAWSPSASVVMTLWA
jgi:hypothetical protein